MVSPRKSSSALGLIPEEGKMNSNATKSCESLYSNSSKGSANIYSRKPPPGLDNKCGGRGIRQPIIPANNEVRQRVLSARRLRIKTFQNQLADAQQTIAELAHENRILRTLHKRQDSALSKYESTNAELPKLLHSHAEELRICQTKCRNLQTINRELEQKLKQKEAVILSLSDQNKYYIQLNKDKNLDDRQRLTEKLQLLESRLQEKDNDIKMMARKLQLEGKHCKQQLQMEQKNNKEVLMKLEKARLELSGLRKLEESQLQEKINVTLRRNKGGNNEIYKDEKYDDKISFNKDEKYDDKISFNKDEKYDDKILFNTATDADTKYTEAPNSQRLTHSTHYKAQHTNRIVKKLDISNICIRTPPNKSIANLRRINRGDGDAFNVQDAYKVTHSKNQQRQHSTLTSMTQPESEKIQNDYEEDYENAEDDELDETHEFEDEVSDNQQDSKGGFIKNIDGEDNEEDIDDYYEEPQKIGLPNTGKKNRMKEEISSIRKQISDDYKEREAFLDTFCRQTTSDVLKEETPKKRNSIAMKQNVPSSRKHILLAALKAIDDKSQD